MLDLHWVKQLHCDAFTFLIEKLYVQLDGMVCDQIVGIHMAISCAPFIADVFLYCYERDFMSNLQKSKRFDLIQGAFSIFVSSLSKQDKKEEIWPSPMTKAPIPTEMSKGQSRNTNNRGKVETQSKKYNIYLRGMYYISSNKSPWWCAQSFSCFPQPSVMFWVSF